MSIWAILEMLFTMVGVLLGVAFFTLVERKVMGSMHYRKGPNKVISAGISQPISDAAKLLCKENLKYAHTKSTLYLVGPFFGLLVMLGCWSAYEHPFGGVSSPLKLIILVTMMSMGVYSLLLMCWGSNSKYALLGGYRSIAQVVSYEVCLVLYILVVVYSSKTFSTPMIYGVQLNYWMAFLCPPLFLMWTTLCMAEASRTPFDLSEGESELVSGFNVEYGGGLFAFIFISEYGMILMLSFLTSIMFLGGSMLVIKTILISLCFIWVRCSFPRVRWDSLMMFSWKVALPLSLCSLSLTLLV